MTPNRKGLPKKSFDETVELKPRADLPRSYHLQSHLAPPKKWSPEYWRGVLEALDLLVLGREKGAWSERTGASKSFEVRFESFRGSSEPGSTSGALSVLGMASTGTSTRSAEAFGVDFGLFRAVFSKETSRTDRWAP